MVTHGNSRIVTNIAIIYEMLNETMVEIWKTFGLKVEISQLSMNVHSLLRLLLHDCNMLRKGQFCI